jgi:hypothetical protein
MNNADGCMPILALCWLVLLGTAICVGGCQEHTWNAEMVKRGLKAYDTKTGKLHWTEKAGGESK